MILLNDFQRQWEVVREATLEAVETVGRSGWYVLGEQVADFERQLARYWGMSHAVGVANGMDAIEIGLRALGCGPGEKVLTTPLSAYATTLAICRAGATPVFVDVDATGAIDLDLCERAFSEDPKIRYFVPVHLYGHSLDLQRLQKLQSRFELRTVEDCAQSIGAAHRGVRAGTVGQVAATSFYPTKNLGAMGDGGALLTNASHLADLSRSLRNYGQSSKYVHDLPGLNSRLDELHAAILKEALLPRLQDWTRRRTVIADRYLTEISHPGVQVIRPIPDSESVWHLYPLRVPPELRSSFRAHLERSAVQSAIHYPGLITDQKALAAASPFEIRGELNHAAEITREEVSIPIHPFLTDHEVDHVVRTVNAWNP